MNENELRQLLTEIRPLALAAGEAILPIAQEFQGQQGQVEIKGDGSPVTRADHAANEVILAGLARLSPDIPVVSEEGAPGQEAEAGPDSRPAPALYWLIDPLDGTKEFIRGYPDYTVNIALIENAIPILGVVAAPAQGSLYYAARGLGACRQTSNAEPEAIRARVQSPPWSAVISRSHSNQTTTDFLARMDIGESLPRGSSMKMCTVAEGNADLYPRFGPTMIWDTAAGTAVAREAGCSVLALDGTALSYDLDQDWRHQGFMVLPQSNQELIAQVNQSRQVAD